MELDSMWCYKRQKKKRKKLKTQQQWLFPEIMTPLLNIINRPCWKQFNRGFIYFLTTSLESTAQKEEERLRASIRRESQQRRMREKQHQRGLSSSYLEPDRYDDEEEGEEAISLAAIKSKYKGGGGLRGEDGVPRPLFSRDSLSKVWLA